MEKMEVTIRILHKGQTILQPVVVNNLREAEGMGNFLLKLENLENVEHIIMYTIERRFDDGK